jgi:putative hydrolase of the HAD superfamily
MTPRAVFFDFGGTLATVAAPLSPPWRVWAEVAHDRGLTIPDADLRAANEEADRQFGDRIYAYHGRTQEFWRLRDLWVLERLGVRSGTQEFFGALQAVFGDPRRVQPFPETVEVLRRTRALAGHLGVISNYTDGLRPILQYHGLDAFFDSVTYSQEVGAEKPDPRVFARALSRAGCAAAEAVHVGDSWEGDYLGARRAGLAAVWLNRDRQRPPSPCRQIRDLRGLLPLLPTIP